MSKEHLLVIEDDEDIRELIRINLVKDGFRVTCVEEGASAMKAIQGTTFDLVLLDLMLPDMHGLDICKFLRRDPKTASLPVVIVTAKREDADIVVGLELGADDYIVKPFSPRVLLARIQAILRRTNQIAVGDDETPIKHDDMVIHSGRREVSIKGKPVELTFTEFQILHLLASRRGWVFTRQQMVNAIRGEDYTIVNRSIDVQIAGLRKKLGSYGRYIETIRAVGYRYADTSARK
ncbi:MAG: response regulator transcription factor [candidate division Zixibacteria bacterium]|nr:response regulator transcription factor [candidate division Zixibacteria bacterium]